MALSVVATTSNARIGENLSHGNCHSPLGKKRRKESTTPQVTKYPSTTFITMSATCGDMLKTWVNDPRQSLESFVADYHQTNPV